MQGRAGVLFDLDGTLIDSALTILEIINGIRSERSHSAATLHDIRPHLSKGGLALVQAALGEAALEPDTDLVVFRERYAVIPQTPTIAYHAVHVALTEIRDRGYPMGVCTNKPEHLARAALVGTELDGFFDVVVAGGPGRPPKPDPAPLYEACALMGIDPDASVLVGDSEADADAAAAAGMRFIAARYGYPVGEPDSLVCHHAIECLTELPAIIDLALNPIQRRRIA